MLGTRRPPRWTSLTLMFQQEVAQRITAQPGTSAYGRLAVLAQPGAGPPLVAIEVAHVGPEARAVVEVHKMGDLVRRQIVQHVGRRKDQAPRE